MRVLRARPRFPERGLLFAIRAGLGLLLLTPLVVLPDVASPFAVGKALYARSLIAVVFALWAVLAAARPAWRPRHSILILLLGASLAAGAAAAVAGVSLQRSLWSEYGRLQGLVDAAHWLALAVVLVAVLRTDDDWRRLLNVNLGVGLAVALAALARFYLPEASGLGWWPEPRYPRIALTLGNPIYLGAFMQAVALLAFGFLARAFLGAPASAAARLFWALAAGSALWALALTGSLGALAGLGAGTGFAALFHGGLGPSGAARRAGRMALFGLAAGALVLAAAAGLRQSGAPGEAARPMFATPLLERATSAVRIGSTLGKRLDNWEAGLQAFAERPLLGWGPGNYLVAASRYDRAAAATNRGRDRAHNVALEEAATKGIPGLLAWLALWGATFAAVLRAARARPAPDRALVVFAGAALAGGLVQSLSAFYTASSWLQHMLLLGFIAHAAIAVRAPPRAAPAALRTVLGALGRPPVRAAGAAAAIALAIGSLTSGHAIHAGAAALYRAEKTGPFMAELRNAIDAFEPLATFPRILLFENIGANWQVLHERRPAAARRLLAWAEAEAPRALAAEPDNWQLHHALTRMYAAVAATDPTDPSYARAARHHYERSLEVAPFQDPMMPGKPRPMAGDRPLPASDSSRR